MADLKKWSKKQNEAKACVESSTIFCDTQSLANLCERRHLSKSLVNWCQDYQENCERITEIAEATKLCGEFPSCLDINLHRSSFNFSQNPRKERVRDRGSRYKVSAKRNNGLFYFVGETEQFKKNCIEESSSEQKEKAQNQTNHAAASTTTSGKSFNNRFEHFAKPEDVISRYIDVHIYNRTRLGKVDKKKLSASIVALRNVQKENSTEFMNKSETVGSFQLRNDKSGNKNILKVERSLPTIKLTEERSTATKNFIFQLGALDDVILSNDKIHRIPCGNAKLIDERRKSRQRVRTSTSSLLPKLHFTELRAIDLNNREGKSIPSNKKVLPDIDGEKISNAKKKETQQSIVDAKYSNWELLKQRRNLAGQGKEVAKSNYLLDKLEKISTQLSKAQDFHWERKIDDYRLKSRFNSILKKDRGVDFVEETARMNRKKKIGISERNIKNEKTLTKFEKRETRALKSEVEKYLAKHSSSLDESVGGRKDEKTVSYPSSETVADMLARLNIHDFGFHINAKKSGGSSPGERQGSRIKDDDDRRVNCKLDNVTETEAGSECRLIKERCEKLSTVEQSSETNGIDKMSNRNRISNGNAFVKMGLKSLEGKIPKHLSSHIMKSEFLNKDLSFKPSYVFESTSNFKNILNSGKSFIFDIPLGNKWLLQKIQTIVKSAGLSDGRSVAKLHEMVNKELNETKGGRNNKKTTTRPSFTQKFLKVHNKILDDPRLKEILPGLICSVENFPKIQTR